MFNILILDLFESMFNIFIQNHKTEQQIPECISSLLTDCPGNPSIPGIPGGPRGPSDPFSPEIPGRPGFPCQSSINKITNIKLFLQKENHLQLYEQKVYNLQDLQANLQFQVGPAGQNRGQREPIVRRVRGLSHG